MTANAPREIAPAGTPGNDALLSRADDPEFHAALQSWLGTLLGGEIVRVAPMLAGTRASWSVDMVRDGQLLPVIVRRPRDSLQIYGDVTREIAIYSALVPTPVPVPQMYGFNPELNVVAAQRIEGTDDLRGLAPADREAISDKFMGHVADLHALDPAELDLPPMATPHTPEEHTTLDVDHWYDFHRRYAPPNPVISYACQWLRRNAPVDVRRTVLVQSDTGPGNFVQHNGEVTAVVDWELSHLGDAYEDLGWVVARSLLFPFGDLRRRFEVYEAASGLPFDRQRIWHSAVNAMVKILIAGDVVRAHGHDDPQYPILVSGPAFHGRLVIEALLGLLDQPMDPVSVEPDRPRGIEREGSLAFLRTTLRERLLPAQTDPAQVAQTKAALRTVRHLQKGEQFDGPIEEQEISELAVLLGGDLDSGAQGRTLLAQQLDTAWSDDPAILTYLGRHVQRETIRMSELLGPMASTPLPTF